MSIVVVDFGMGNLRSVSKALEKWGAQVLVSHRAADVAKAEKLVLPGVGAFGEAMREIKERSLLEPLRQFLASGKPFLGICLGLQLLFERSEESAGTQGLGVFKGEVRRFVSKDIKVPHMGWNQVHTTTHPSILGAISSQYFYFVHSYYAVPTEASLILGTTAVGSETFASAVGRDAITAVQFHPEKSQAAGLAVLRRFISSKG